MKKLIFSLLLAGFSGTINADCFYIKAGSGVSFSGSSNIFAPPETWTPAVQGYNSSLGNCGIASFSVGCEFCRWMDVEVGISNRSTFEYRKFQTPVGGGDSYTREFDLDVTPVLFSVNFLGRDIACLNWSFACGEIYPIVGVGVGVSNLLITNFRTTGLAPSGDSAPFASFSSENQYTQHKNFTYTALVGFEYNYNDSWAVATGYRWFDAGNFNGPRFFRVDTGAAVDVADQEWRMDFKANEWFIELKIYL